MIKRKIETALKNIAKKFPVITITGPRQSGKTTLCKSVFPNYTYVSLENPDNKDFALEDPKGFLKQYNSKVIIDEAQNAPKLFSYIQEIVDNSETKGQFILSGSQNFLLLEKISQTLAGRTYIFHLLPFSLEELKPTKYYSKNIDENIFKGGYPRLYKDALQPTEFFPSYIQTYIERDIRSITNVQNLSLFKQFIKLCAGRTGQILNTNSIGNQLGIDHKTVKRWLSILEASFIIYLLKPWHKNFNKRIIKSPKLYFYDTGLACNLLGIKNKNDVKNHFSKGALFENFIINELLKADINTQKDNDLYYWRNKNGNEMDLVIENGMDISFVEIKASQTINASFFNGLNYLNSISDALATNNYLIYGGDTIQQRTDCHVIPWTDLDKL